MKTLSTPQMRTILLSTLFVVTGLVAYRTLASRPSDPARPVEQELKVEVESPDAPQPPSRPKSLLPADVRREVEAAMAEVAAQLESVRLELEGEEGTVMEQEESADRVEGFDLPAMSAARSARGNEEAAIQKRFDVADGGQLRVQVPGANVQVETGESGSVEVVVFISGRDKERAREQFERLRYEVYQSGNEIVVRTRPEKGFRWNISGRSGLRVRVLARIPTVFDADITTSGGNIALQDLDGRVALKTSGGNVDVSRVTGPEVRVTTSGGNISVGHLESNSVQLATSGGDIKGDVLDSPSVDLRTSGGDIRFTTVNGSTKARTSGGRIQVEGVRGDLDAATSGGRIEVVMIEEAPMTLRTSGGNIVIHAPRGLQADVSLRGGSVKVDEPFHVAGRVRPQSVDGSINGGGVRIDASTSGGSVSLRVRS